MKSGRLLLVLLGLVALLVAGGAACGASGPPANDQTVVTLEHPSGSAAAQPTSVPSPATSK